MLHKMPSAYQPSVQLRAVAADPQATIDAGEAWSIVRRHAPLILMLTLLALAAAWLYAGVARERFVANAQILIDPRDLQMFEREVNPRALSTDSGVNVVESQARVLGSDSVLLKAIAKLGLDKDPEFNGAQEPSSDTLTSKIQRAVRGPTAPAGDATLTALSVLKRNLLIKRSEKSFVVDIVTYAGSAEKAARIANGIADVYLAEQADTRASIARQAAQAIEGRLAELKRRVAGDEARIAKYRADKDLVSAGGRYMSEQQLADLGNQVNAAQAETARARARFEEIDASRNNPESIPEAVRSETLRVLRAQHANVVRERARLSTQFRPAHPRMIDINTQEAQSQKLILDEIRRIADSAKLDFRRAQAGEQSLRATLELARRQSNDTSNSLVELRELERALEASRSVYQASLVRVREAKEQAELNTTNARVITAATPSLDKMWPPRKGLLLPVALLGGLGLGTALAFLLEAVRRSRPYDPPSPSETRPLASALRPEARIEPVRAAITRAPGRAQSVDNDAAAGPAPKAGVEAFAFADLRGATGAAFTPASLATAMIDNPAAPVSRQLTQLYLSLRRSARDGATRSVLIVPDRHSPMKSEVALGLAVAGGMAGDRVLLIDADGASRTLSETLCPDTRIGLGDVLAGRARLADAVVTYPDTSIEILASTVSAKAARIELATFSTMLKSATAYDLVVVDGAPLGHRHSSLAAAHSVSDILFAIGPGGASFGNNGDILASTLRATPKFRGIVLTD